MSFSARYLLLLIFILVVVAAMFFIYSNVNSTEMVVYFDQSPTWRQKANCIIRGGAVEIMEGFEYSDKLAAITGKNVAEDAAFAKHYLCHYH